MPEFILDTGDDPRFEALDDFTKGYIEAMFFTDAQYSGEDECAGMTVADLAPDSFEAIREDCERFQREHRADLDEALDNGRINGYDDRAAGRDFWYTRNGHGVGFWDRGLGDIGETLSKHAHACGERTPYKGDDERMHVQ